MSAFDVLNEGIYVPGGVAMGAINGINEAEIRARLDSFLASPLALACMGSIGTKWNEGNRGTTYFHDPMTGETVNAMGLPGLGIDGAEPLIREYSPKFADMGKILVVGATSLRGEDPGAVLPELMERILSAGAQVAEANYSCPNIVTAGGGRKPILGYDVEAFEHVRGEIIRAIGTDAEWQEKLPPYYGDHAALIPEVAATYSEGRRLGRVGVTGFNTMPGVEMTREDKPVLRIIADVDGEEVITYAGGLSGPAVAGTYLEIQEAFLGHLPEGVPFIAAGGVWDGYDVAMRMADDPRVVAATSVSRFWENESTGNSFGRTATQIAEEYLEAAA